MAFDGYGAFITPGLFEDRFQYFWRYKHKGVYADDVDIGFEFYDSVLLH
jgi:hypothetical protein